MHAALREHFGDIARWTDPEGGFFLWVTLDNGVDATELFELALAEGVAFIPGSGLLPVRPIHRRAAAVLRLDPAGPDPRRARPAAPGRRPARRRADRRGRVRRRAGRAGQDRRGRAGGADPSLLRATGQNPPGEEAATVAVLGAAAAELGLDVCETTVRPGRNNLRDHARRRHRSRPAAARPYGRGSGRRGLDEGPVRRCVENGRIYGRGASDMKGGLAASLAALAALRGAGLSGPVELAALVDEEETGEGIRAYVESVNARFVGCVTAEPTDLQTIIGARGASYLRVEIHGIACHAGNPGDGANAIYGAAAVVAEIERMHARTGAAAAPAAGAGDLERRADPRRHRRLHRARRVRGRRRPSTAARRVDRHRAGRACATEWPVCGWAIAA